MAFDNVFGRIDFQSGNKMAMAKQQQNMQMVGQALGQYNKQKDRDLQTRQLDMKANEEQAFNLKRVAEQAAYKAGQGMELSPQEQGAIKAYDAMNPNFFTGEFGQQKQATGLAGLLGGQPQMAQGINPNAQQPQSSMGNVMDIPPMPAQAVGGLPQGSQVPADGTSLEVLQGLYKPSADIAKTPYGRKNKEMFDLEMGKLAAQEKFKAAKETAASAADKKEMDAGKVEFERQLEQAMGALDELHSQGGTMSSTRGVGGNIGAYAADLPFVGTPAQSIFDPETQTQRNILDGKRPALFNAIKKATGMTGGELNSQFEVENQLKQLGNASMTYEARKALLSDLSTSYGNGTMAKKTTRDGLAKKMGLTGGKPKLTLEQATAMAKQRGL